MKKLQWVIAIVSIVGALLVGMLPVNMQLTGFILFLLANILSMVLFTKQKLYALVVQQIFFTITSINGIYQRIL